MPHTQQFIEIAKINSAHALKGEVKILSYTETANDFLQYSQFFLDKTLLLKNGDHLNHLSLEKGKVNGENNLIVKFAELHDRNDAEAVAGMILRVPAEVVQQVNTKEKDEYYQFELLGLQVYDDNQKLLGTVADVQNYGAGLVIEITAISGDDFTLPYNKEYVHHIDLNAHTMIVKPLIMI